MGANFTLPLNKYLSIHHRDEYISKKMMPRTYAQREYCITFGQTKTQEAGNLFSGLGAQFTQWKKTEY